VSNLEKCELGVGVVALLAMSACASTQTAVPARLASSDAAAQTQLRQVLARAMGKQQVTLGPEPLATTTFVSVLPMTLGTYETRSLSLPEVFDIRKQANTCTVVRRSTGQIYSLANLRCIAVKTATK
jgi:hypothetical protein